MHSPLAAFLLAAVPAAAMAQELGRDTPAPVSTPSYLPGTASAHPWKVADLVRGLVPSGWYAGHRGAAFLLAPKEGALASATLEWGPDTEVRIGLARDAARDDALPAVHPFAHRSMFSLELTHRTGRGALVASAGFLRERSTPLCASQAGAILPNPTTRTVFAAVSGSVELSPRLALVGMLAAGRTASWQPDARFEERPDPVPAVATVAWSGGLSARGLFDPSDRAGLTFTVPVRVAENGGLGAVMPREDGMLAFTSRALNLRASVLERDVELSYSRAAGKDARVTGGLMLRLRPGSDRTEPNDVLLGVRYARSFR
ncbi:MAG TPA: hypothetical protein VFF16_08575 [Telluria sp.]|nr:hypothetical protein [Telluria sp.]